MTAEEAITALGDRNNLLWGMSKEEKKYYSEALDMAISALKDNTEESEDQSVEWYCTDCPYFQYTGDPTDYWYGARCNKDKHEVNPSMMAIQELNNNCPLNRG